MKSILLLTTIALIFGGLYLSSSQEEIDSVSMFNNWKTNFGKKYNQMEEEFRYRVYVENQEKINNHNADWTQSYKMGENHLMDLTHEEFVQIYLNAFDLPQSQIEEQSLTEEQLSSIPNGIDWRGYTKMKEQGQCAAGWAFSVTSSIEAFYYIRGGGQMIDLSEQHLVDCEVYSTGCSGGYNSYAFSYAQTYGIRNRTDYPYVAYKQQCRYNNGPYKINSYQQIVGETNLRYALNSLPVSVGVDATNWQFYSSGVFGNCAKAINHFALNVGFENNTNNWFIKNSWGSIWGEAGHIRLFPGDTCAVTQYAFQNL